MQLPWDGIGEASFDLSAIREWLIKPEADALAAQRARLKQQRDALAKARAQRDAAAPVLDEVRASNQRMRDWSRYKRDELSRRKTGHEGQYRESVRRLAATERGSTTLIIYEEQKCALRFSTDVTTVFQPLCLTSCSPGRGCVEPECPPQEIRRMCSRLVTFPGDVKSIANGALTIHGSDNCKENGTPIGSSQSEAVFELHRPETAENLRTVMKATKGF